MRHRRCRNKSTAVVLLFGAALVCLCFLSFKLMLILIAAALIAAGVWLLIC